MKKLIAVALLLNVVLLAGRFWQELKKGAPVVAEQGGGADHGERACQKDHTLWSIDSNNDEKVDLSDAVWLLGWLFLGTPEPQRCLAVCDPPLRCEDITQLNERIETLEKLVGAGAITSVYTANAVSANTGGQCMVTPCPIDGTKVDFLLEKRSSVTFSGLIFSNRRAVTIGLNVDNTPRRIVQSNAGVQLIPITHTLELEAGQHQAELTGFTEQPTIDPIFFGQSMHVFVKSL